MMKYRKQLDTKLEGDLRALYVEPSGLFHNLVAAARLDPKTDFCDRDLRDMCFAGADLRGFNFSKSDLRGTLVRCAGKIDETTGLINAKLDPDDREWLLRANLGGEDLSESAFTKMQPVAHGLQTVTEADYRGLEVSTTASQVALEGSETVVFQPPLLMSVGPEDTVLSERARLLSRLPLFKGLPARDLEALAAQTHERLMRAGEVLFRCGDPGGSMLAIVAGEVRIGLYDADRREQAIKLLRPGDACGEIALLDGGPRTANATAETNGRLLVVGRRDLLRLLKEDRELALRVIVLLCDRLRSTDQLLEMMLFHGTSARLASVILNLSSGRPGSRLDITQRALSEIVGAARETINEKLRKWQDEGAISLEPGRITLVNPTPLERFVHRRDARASGEARQPDDAASD